LQATSLPLSSSLGQKAVDIFMNEEKIQKDLEKINKVLRQVTFDGKKLVITYNSVQLSNALSRFPSPD
jgi:stalled ribosome rescue protein Dom34